MQAHIQSTIQDSKKMFRPFDQDVFVRDLNRQLRTPSHWLPVNSCKKEDKEAP